MLEVLNFVYICIFLDIIYVVGINIEFLSVKEKLMLDMIFLEIL